jgi:hypothetical protein
MVGAWQRKLGWLVAGCAVAIAGCSSDQFGAELSARPRPSAIRTPEGTTFRVPEDQPFVIALQRKNSAAGLEGQADADATAGGDGHAGARVRVVRAGQAQALFQLGSAFVNDTERTIDLECALHFRYRLDISQEPRSAAKDGALGLRLYAREARGRMLREMNLFDVGSEEGAARRDSEEHLEFTLTISPGETVNVYLAGQARADIPAERSLTAELKVSDVRLHAVSHAAPDVPVQPPGAPPPAAPAPRP